MAFPLWTFIKFYKPSNYWGTMNMVAFEMDCKHGESMMSSEPPSHTFPSLDKSDTRLMIFVLECSNDSFFWIHSNEVPNFTTSVLGIRYIEWLSESVQNLRPWQYFLPCLGENPDLSRVHSGTPFEPWACTHRTSKMQLFGARISYSAIETIRTKSKNHLSHPSHLSTKAYPMTHGLILYDSKWP